MKKIACLLLSVSLFSFLFAATPRTYTFGKVQVAQNNELPSGYFAKAQHYLPGDNISISNPDTGMEINVLNLGTLPESEDTVLLLAPEAASRLGIDYSSSLQVKISPRPGNFDEIASGTAVLSYGAVASNTVDDSRLSGTAGRASADEEPEADLSAVTKPSPREEDSGKSALSLIFPPEVLEQLGTSSSSRAADEQEEQDSLEERSGPAVAKVSSADESDILESKDVVDMDPAGSLPPASEGGIIVVDSDSSSAKTPRVVTEVKPRGTAKKEEPAKVSPLVSDNAEELVAAEELAPVPSREMPPAVTTKPEPVQPPEDLAVFDDTIFDVSSRLPDGSIVEYEEEEYTEESDITLIPTIPLVPEYNPAYAVKEKPKAKAKPESAPAAKPAVASAPVPTAPSPVASAPASAKAAEAEKPKPKKEETVAPPAAPAVAAVTPASHAGGVSDVDAKIVEEKNLPKGYYIQIATTSTKDGAEKLLKKHKKYPLLLVPFASREGYKVLVGPLSADEYGAVLTKFKAFGYKDAFVKKP